MKVRVIYEKKSVPTLSMISLPADIEVENKAKRFSYALAAIKHPLEKKEDHGVRRN